MASGKYIWRNVRAGDYRGSENREEFVQALLGQARRVQTDDERAHFADQVSFCLAARSITGEQGKKIYLAAGI